MRYHHIEVTVETQHKPSYYTGSMLRGAMGHTLKRVTCINPSYQCEGCFAASSCVYHGFYEAVGGYHEYRFDIELGSGRFDFGLYLYEGACDSVVYVLSAIEMMLTQIGLTKHNYRCHDIAISLNGTSIYADGKFTILDATPRETTPSEYHPDLKIQILTPIRIKRNNRLLRDDIDIEDILRSIYQRYTELTQKQKIYTLPYTPTYTTTIKLLRHKQLTRKSHRQKQTMNMDGIIGEIATIGIDQQSHDLLKLGEIIGVGKQTVMGLGRIEVENV